ncbi:acid protease [Ophiobolus disseminans]|uniref:Acid protease n=1 Tax=Ophiobolus disseminans TaxID=1469910 RepID=A0A6A6ZNF6_9PLEO|nr:acid protease [Ophiobolus disseminans]
MLFRIYAHSLSVLLVGTRLVSSAQTSTGVPLVVPPSGQWDGIDGPWSTFNLGVGKPIQSFRCVPGISDPVVMLPLESQECKSTSTNQCRDRTTFFSSRSSTWNETGFAEIPFSVSLEPGFHEHTNGNPETAVWGSENVYFGHNELRDLGVARQFVLEVPNIDFFVGVFGLAVGSVSATGVQRRTLLEELYSASAIPSRSFSYTAGSAKKNTTGSLILGGYDTSRFNESTTLFGALPSPQNTSLYVHIQSIFLSGSKPVSWSSPIGSQPPSFRIDSVLPQIWLPLDACRIFEAALNLTWDDKLQLYLINDTTHANLVQEDPAISFSITNDPRGLFKNFTLPYSSFNLQLFPPLTTTKTYYFPLKRAIKHEQYLLGRAFLQETYITVDYERSTFNLSQAYSNGGSAYMVPILSPSKKTADNATSSGKRIKLSTGASVGIGVGVGVLVLCTIGVLIAGHRTGFRLGQRKSQSHFPKTTDEHDHVQKSELHGESVPKPEAMGVEMVEMPDRDVSEIMGTERVELEGERSELEAVEARCELGGEELPTS